MKKFLLFSLLLAVSNLTLMAQAGTELKWNTGVSMFMAQNEVTTEVKSRAAAGATTLDVLIDCTDAQEVVKIIEAAGGCTIIDAFETVVTGKLTEEAIRRVAGLESVVSISASRKHRPFISDARSITGIDKIHNGTSIETPFTGKGVLIGVIDQGFQYKHRAFLDEDGNSRLRGLWIRYNSSGVQNTKYEDPARIPDLGDGLNTGGHGTHVANIAAGSKWGEHGLHGVAPDAELIFIPSSFDDTEMYGNVRFVKDIAEEEGKPWVINMSFGSHFGPHDGSTDVDQKLTGLCEDGGILVAAMGNEGKDKIHVHHSFEKAGTVSLIVSKGSIGENNFCIWGEKTDGQYHLSVKPFLYNTNTKKRDYKTTSFWREKCVAGIDTRNKKENWSIRVPKNSQYFNQLVGVEITGAAGDGFHAWSNDAIEGEFLATDDAAVLEGNSEYCVGEGSATIPASIAVGAYTTSVNWTALVDGNSYNYDGDASLTTRGDICGFSGHGPLVGSDYAKPTILAPGSAIKSAVSRFSPGFKATSSEIVAIERYNGTDYHYGVMAGTSMASPFVTGVIALWLEAYPELKYGEAIDILKKTAKRDKYTGRTEGWDAIVGYGKIDPYEGLKEVLSLAKASGIDDVLNDERSVSFSKHDDAWRVLFNTNETYGKVSLYDMSGRLVKMQSVDGPRRGDELVFPLSDLPAGTYFINVNTTKNSVTRKFIKK